MYCGNPEQSSNNSCSPLEFHDIEKYIQGLDTQDEETQSLQALSNSVQPPFPDQHSDLDQRSQQTPSNDSPPQSSHLQSHTGPRPQHQVPEVALPLAQPLQPEDKDNSNILDSDQTYELLNTSEVLETALDLAEIFRTHKKDLCLSSSNFPIYYDCPFLPKVNEVTKEIQEADEFIDDLVKIRMDYDTMCKKFILTTKVEFKKPTTNMRPAKKSKGNLHGALPNRTNSKMVSRKESEETGSSNSPFVDVEILDESDEVMPKEIRPKVDKADDAMSAAYATDVKISASVDCQVDLSKIDLSKAGKIEVEDKFDLDINDALEMALEVITVELDQQKQPECLTENATVVTAELDTKQSQQFRTHTTSEHDNQCRSYGSKPSVVTVELEDQQEHCLIKQSSTHVELEHYKIQSHSSNAMTSSAELPQRQSQRCKRAAVTDVKHNQRCQNANDRSITTNENEYHQLKRQRSEEKTATVELDRHQQHFQTLKTMAATTEPVHHWQQLNVSEASQVTSKLEKRSQKGRKTNQSTADLEHHQQQEQSSKIASAIAEWEQQRHAGKAKSATAKMENQKQYRSNATVMASKPQRCSPNLDHYQQLCNTSKPNFSIAKWENYQQFYRNTINTTATTAQLEHHQDTNFTPEIKNATSQLANLLQQRPNLQSTANKDELQHHRQQYSIPSSSTSGLQHRLTPTPTSSTNLELNQQQQQKPKASNVTAQLAQYLQQRQIPKERSLPSGQTHQQTQHNTLKRTAADASLEYHQHQRHTTNAATSTSTQLELNQQAQRCASRRTSVFEFDETQRQIQTPQRAFVTSTQHPMLVNFDSEPNNCTNYNPQLAMEQNKATERVFAPFRFTAQPQQYSLNPFQSNLNLQTSLNRQSPNPMDLPSNSQPCFESHQRADQAMHQFHFNQITLGRPQREHNAHINNSPQVNSGARLMIKYNHRTAESSQSSLNTFNTSGAAPERLRILSNAERIQAQMANRNSFTPMSTSNPFIPQYSFQSNQNFNTSTHDFSQPFSPQTPRGAQHQ